MKDVVILTGAGQIGMAIARRISMGKKLVIGDKSRANGEAITKIMNEAGFDAVFVERVYSESYRRSAEIRRDCSPHQRGRRVTLR